LTAAAAAHRLHSDLRTYPCTAVLGQFGSSAEREARGQVSRRVQTVATVRALNLCSCNGLGCGGCVRSRYVGSRHAREHVCSQAPCRRDSRWRMDKLAAPAVTPGDRRLVSLRRSFRRGWVETAGGQTERFNTVLLDLGRPSGSRSPLGIDRHYSPEGACCSTLRRCRRRPDALW
jgi:hypothetical protein